ncbi:MAG TPA: ATP-binding protein [Cytophagaceae bacterium]|jgi:PAS domain S-box-containing protein|nr:ATP-binding protein [Cytophagaceae bacterium]
MVMHDNKNLNVLVVEDDEDDFFLLESNLKATTFCREIFWAVDFNATKKYLEEKTIDIALIDYRLGAYTGIDVISFISNEHPFIPTILLTGLKEAAIDEEALRSGAYDYLVKDQYSIDILDRSIRYAVEKARVLKSLKQSESKFRNLFENALEYIFIIDSDYKVIDVNQSALKIVELENKADLIGLTITDFISIDPQAGSFLDVLKNNLFDTFEIEIEISAKSTPRKVHCMLHFSTIDASLNITQLVLYDITELKEKELRDKLLEKQALTGKTAQVIAHEIKNPLSNIQLSLGELKQILGPLTFSNPDENPHVFIDIIDRNSKRINNLIEDLLNATRFNTVNFEEVTLTEVLNEALALVQDRITLKGIYLSKGIETNVKINADKEKLVIALLNILVNAIEAVEEKTGKLILAVFEETDMVSITITDNGKGIPTESLSKLFEPFFTSKRGGSGLGLTATYNIITKHNGSIKVKSKENIGTSFIVTLPVVGIGNQENKAYAK